MNLNYHSSDHLQTFKGTFRSQRDWAHTYSSTVALVGKTESPTAAQNYPDLYLWEEPTQRVLWDHASDMSLIAFQRWILEFKMSNYY